ncbi:Phosphotransferase enzyme family domain protein [Penicillium coprophilum]|uniref:Phosphotransferase enzyme family domain protein n=1 Tax=Penicillium coprophilum TaxID=36646 RepID=UPI002394F452|nr:Phosphotransferase enzyme family domain protein [Penicillium coprophilum]KAJ5170963.1 Phosphotransferase enzyme family domain protein [Penicillium coprophilum]
MAESVRQSIDISSLEKYLNQFVREIKAPLDVKQFTFGQSNPTYLLTAADEKRYVLRKKPPGQLPPKTHLIEREYAMIQYLQGTDVPVPKAYWLCREESIIGTPFFIMEFLEGRIFTDSTMPGVSPGDRTALWQEAVRTLAKIHRIDLNGARQLEVGNTIEYYNRQISIFMSLSKAQSNVVDLKTNEKIGEVPYFDEMVHFFSKEAYQPRDRCVIVHGDYKIDNLVFHNSDPRIIGVLDWEMATIGNPLSDFCNLTHPYFWGGLKQNVELFRPGRVLGLPTRETCTRWYAEDTGWDPTADLPWGDAFFAFRTTSMLQSIKARYVQGHTSSDTAAYYASRVDQSAFDAWELVKEVRTLQKNPVLESKL